MSCLLSSRFTMSALLIHPSDAPSDPTGRPGTWTQGQDPITGEIVRQWTPDPTDGMNSSGTSEKIDCMARGIITNGVRGQANTETFGAIYENLEIVQLRFPPDIIMAKSDRITNITDASGNIKFLDYQFNPTNPVPTMFDVEGVTPVFDPFNNHIENFALLSRSQ